MTCRILDSGCWHVRLGLNRFAQWQVGRTPTSDDFFGWWSEQERAHAIELTSQHRHHASRDGATLVRERTPMTREEPG